MIYPPQITDRFAVAISIQYKDYTRTFAKHDTRSRTHWRVAWTRRV